MTRKGPASSRSLVRSPDSPNSERETLVPQVFVPDRASCGLTTSGTRTRAPRLRAVRWIIRVAALVLLGLVLVSIPAGVADSVDAGSKLLQARALVGNASLSIPPQIRGESVDHVFRGRDGLWYSIHGIGLPLVWIVPVAMANVVTRSTGMSASVLAGFAVSFVNPLIIAGTIASLVLILRRLAASRRAQIVTVAVFALGAMTLPYANSCWGEPLVGLLILWSVAAPLILVDSYRTACISRMRVSAATLVRPEMVLLCSPLLLIYRENWRRGAALCAGASAGPLIVLLLNFLTTGSIFVFGHGDEVTRFGDPRPGFWGLTLGLERSVVVYCPGLVLRTFSWSCLPAAGRLGRARLCVLTTVGLYFSFYAAWHGWTGGYCFGPRYLYSLAAIAALPIGPALCAWVERLTYASA